MRASGVATDDRHLGAQHCRHRGVWIVALREIHFRTAWLVIAAVDGNAMDFGGVNGDVMHGGGAEYGRVWWRGLRPIVPRKLNNL